MNKKNKIIIGSIAGALIIAAVVVGGKYLLGDKKPDEAKVGEIDVYPKAEEKDIEVPDGIFEYFVINRNGKDIETGELNINTESTADYVTTMDKVMIDVLGENHGVVFSQDESDPKIATVDFTNAQALESYYFLNENFKEVYPNLRENATDMEIPSSFRKVFYQTIEDTILANYPAESVAFYRMGQLDTLAQ